MAKTDALSILESQETKDKLAELDGKLIESIQKDALSMRLKNTEYSGDPTTGSVSINRFKNSEASDYGTARAAGKGTQLVNSGKVTINVDTNKEITEEIEKKDLLLFGIAGLADRRTANHSKRMAADLDRAFFRIAEAAATGVDLTGDIEKALETIIQQMEKTENDWVDGVDRENMELTLSVGAYGLIRGYVDKIDGGVGVEEAGLFHGVKIYSNVRQAADVLLQYHGSVGQPVKIDNYGAERIPLSNAYAIQLFYSYGTKAIMPDLILKADKLA